MVISFLGVRTDRHGFWNPRMETCRHTKNFNSKLKIAFFQNDSEASTSGVSTTLAPSALPKKRFGDTSTAPALKRQRVAAG